MTGPGSEPACFPRSSGASSSSSLVLTHGRVLFFRPRSSRRAALAARAFQHPVSSAPSISRSSSWSWPCSCARAGRRMRPVCRWPFAFLTPGVHLLARLRREVRLHPGAPTWGGSPSTWGRSGSSVTSCGAIVLASRRAATRLGRMAPLPAGRVSPPCWLRRWRSWRRP